MQEAEKWDAHIATASTIGKNRLLKNYANNIYVFGGAVRNDETGIFEWVTGEEWNYEDWGNLDPNDASNINNKYSLFTMSNGLLQTLRILLCTNGTNCFCQMLLLLAGVLKICRQAYFSIHIIKLYKEPRKKMGHSHQRF